MSPGQIKARKKWVLGNKKRKSPMKHHAYVLHQRGYHNGDIKCVKCGKWLNENNWKEAKEILVGPTGKKVHDSKYCDSNGMYAAAFSTVPRYAVGRRRRMEKLVRY
jgi:hypothetical protein